MKTTFETLGGTYRQEGDYLLPNLEAPESPQICIWGERRRRYLREHEKAAYTAMLLSGELNAHLEEVDRSASEMFDRFGFSNSRTRRHYGAVESNPSNRMGAQNERNPQSGS